MAAVKSLAEPGTSQTAREQKKMSMQHNIPSAVKIQKQNLNSELRSMEAYDEAWTSCLPRDRSNTFPFSQSFSADHSVCYRSPELVEMDEIMAAMVLTSLSCSSVIQSPPQRDLLPSGFADMDCGGGELSDSGSSGYWSWEHGSVSPAPSPSVTETDSSLDQMVDKGLHMELEPGAYDELDTRRCKILSRGAYRCLWPACGKVLTSRVGMKHHIRILHLGSNSLEQSQREEDFYYTEILSEDEEPMLPSSSPVFNSGPWSVCRFTQSQPNSEEAPPFSSTLSQSAPSSVWQIHTEHLYQAWVPADMTISSDFPSSSIGISGGPPSRPQIITSRSRSISVGEQWLQRNSLPTRSHTISASPSRGHCSIRKGRGEARKCRKVYGVEHKDQWCTACRWKKACQRFPD